MPIGAIIGAGASLLGGSMQSRATRQAAETSARAQLESARLAAEAAKFRPVGVTTRFGSSNFQFDPSGYLTGAGYTVSPELQAYQDRLQALTGGALTQAEMAQQQYAPLQQSATGLFGLGQQYLQQTPEQVASQYMRQQQDLLAPSRERQMAQLQNQLFQQGRGGLSVGATGARPSGAAGLGATTPEMEAYYNALAQQDLQLASQAQQAGQQNVAFGAGLLGTGAGLMGQYQAGQVGALSPFTSYLGAGSTIESLGQQPLEMGRLLGGQSASAGGNVGQALLTGGLGAARTLQSTAGSGLGAALTGLGNNPYIQQGLNRYFNPPQQQAFSDAYQASIPVNNLSSGYY
jgi:gas vesicle protein